MQCKVCGANGAEAHFGGESCRLVIFGDFPADAFIGHKINLFQSLCCIFPEICAFSETGY